MIGAILGASYTIRYHAFYKIGMIQFINMSKYYFPFVRGFGQVSNDQFAFMYPGGNLLYSSIFST